MTVELLEHGKGIAIGDWHFRFEKGPIASSEELEKMQDRLKINLPGMVFANNLLDIDDAGSFRLKFDAEGALSKIGLSNPNLKVKAAKHWDGRREHKDVQALESPSDWTYTSTYMGELVSGVKEIKENSDKTINYEQLKRRDIPVQFFNEMVLCEDELDDNGVSIYTVRIVS